MVGAAGGCVHCLLYCGFPYLSAWEHWALSHLLFTPFFLALGSCISVLPDALSHYNTRGFICMDESAQSEGAWLWSWTSRPAGIRAWIPEGKALVSSRRLVLAAGPFWVLGVSQGSIPDCSSLRPTHRSVFLVTCTSVLRASKAP